MSDSEKLLHSFFVEMNSWEVGAHALVKKNGIENVRDQIRESLENIYKQFLNKSGGKTGRLAGPNVGFPPEYDPDHEIVKSITELDSGESIIETEWRHPVMKDFVQQQRYSLVKKGEGWRISKKERFSASLKKWNNMVF